MCHLSVILSQQGELRFNNVSRQVRSSLRLLNVQEECHCVWQVAPAVLGTAVLLHSVLSHFLTLFWTPARVWALCKVAASTSLQHLQPI